MPKTISSIEAKATLGSVVSWVLKNEDEVIVEENGEPAVVIISFSEYERIKGSGEQERRSQALARLERLRDTVRARNDDLTSEEGDDIANRFSHDLVADLAEQGKIKFEQ